MFEWINSSIKNYIISVVEKEFFESNDDRLTIQKLNNNAIIPVKATKLAAGYDLYSIDAITIPPLSRVLVNIGLSIKTPEGTYGRIAPRSGMALNGIDVGGGVIDQDYTGPLKVILINNNKDEFKVVEGMKVAQLVCEKICLPEIQIVDKLEQTERGSNGFGSTDILNSTELLSALQSSTFQKTQINKFELSHSVGGGAHRTQAGRGVKLETPLLSGPGNDLKPEKNKFTTNDEDKSTFTDEKPNEELKKEN